MATNHFGGVESETTAPRPSKPRVGGSSPSGRAPQPPVTTEEDHPLAGVTASAPAGLPHPGPIGARARRVLVARSPVETGVAVLKAFKPETIFAHDYEVAVRLILEAVGWRPPPPPHQRVGRVVAGLLAARGAMTYAALQSASGLSVGAVANGLKACGAVVVRKEHKQRHGKGSGKPTFWYALPSGEVRP